MEGKGGAGESVVSLPARHQLLEDARRKGMPFAQWDGPTVVSWLEVSLDKGVCPGVWREECVGWDEDSLGRGGSVLSQVAHTYHSGSLPLLPNKHSYQLLRRTELMSLADASQVATLG